MNIYYHAYQTYSTSKYTITPNQIAKKSVYTHIAIKDSAKEIVDKEIDYSKYEEIIAEMKEEK